MKIRIVYLKSHSNGMNAGDSEMLGKAEAEAIVKSGFARYDKKPSTAKSKSTEKDDV